MGRVTVFTNLTLDGVMQAPGRPDEDTRDGFAHGGWAVPYAAMQQGGDPRRFGGALLFGRRTYEDFYSVWPKRKDSPFTPVLENAQKYVASRTLQEPLPWANSKLLKGEAQRTVAALKKELDRDLLVLGSGELVQALRQANLVDEYVLFLHPLVLGAGRRLFPDRAAFATLKLHRSKSTPNGVIIATYRSPDSEYAVIDQYDD